jgi:hypothetical protein
MVIRGLESLAVAPRPLQRRFAQISCRFCFSDILILNLRKSA